MVYMAQAEGDHIKNLASLANIEYDIELLPLFIIVQPSAFKRRSFFGAAESNSLKVFRFKASPRFKAQEIIDFVDRWRSLKEPEVYQSQSIVSDYDVQVLNSVNFSRFLKSGSLTSVHVILFHSSVSTC